MDGIPHPDTFLYRNYGKEIEEKKQENQFLTF